MWKRFGALNLPAWEKQLLHQWEAENTFEKTLIKRANSTPFVFYEGPPFANGRPGIHHVFARTLKDLVCRYQTMKGYYVLRRAGWDTQGLPVELSVEKELNLTRADIGTKISIADYNKACREAVMRYKQAWDELTRRMGYWVRLEDPYITFDPKYIESVWYLLKQLYDRGLLYKSYAIQPYSPAAGTALSQHELNLPGAYRPVRDPLSYPDFTPSCFISFASLFLYLPKLVPMTRQRQTYSTISDLKKDFLLFSPIYSLVSKTFTHLTRPKLKNLSALILTFFQHTSFALYNIPQAFPANTTQKHKHKALLRALKNILLDEQFYSSYLKILFALPGLRLLRHYTPPLLIDV